VARGLYRFDDIHVIDGYLAVGMDLYRILESGGVKYLGRDGTDRVLREIIGRRDIPYYRFWARDDNRLGFGYSRDMKKLDARKLEHLMPEGFTYSDSSYVCRRREGVLNSFYVKDDDLYSVRMSGKGWRISGVYNDTKGVWYIEPADEGASYFLHPTNDPDIWIWENSAGKRLYHVRGKEIDTLEECAVYGLSYTSPGPMEVNYPGVYYAYQGHRKR
jgi:hypothetical protein